MIQRSQDQSHYNDQYSNQQMYSNSAVQFKINAPKPKRLPSEIKKKAKQKIKKHEKQKQENKSQNLMKQSNGMKSQRPVSQRPQTQQNNKKHRSNKSYEAIAEVLSFMLNQFKMNSQIVNKTRKIYDWELEELRKQHTNPQLADFLIKLPNPSKIQQDEEKPLEMDIVNVNIERKQQDLIDLQQALNIYRNIFNLQESKSIYQDEKEQVAFILAFFLMHIQKCEPTNFTKHFHKIYHFYMFIKDLSLQEFLKKRKQASYLNIQTALPNDFKDIVYRILERQEGSKNDKKKQFTQLKDMLYDYLSNQLKKIEQIQSIFCMELLSTCGSISQFLVTFPFLMKKAIKQSVNSTKKHLLKGGSNLKKVIQDNIFVWINYQGLPKDFMSLLRNCFLYRLTRRCYLQTRCFLSRDQNYIFIAVKNSQEVMQNYAQQTKMNMQVDLGATDLFSFEPLDQYFRPLRVSSYVRDRQFIKKYDLKLKMDKDSTLQVKSIESQCGNFYKKALRMNKDELRAKIILDQQDVDDAIRWVSNVLDIDYIKHNDVLENKYNQRSMSSGTWQTYYVFNKIILQYIQRAQSIYKKTPQIKDNLGMLLRLMFLKAQHLANQTHIQCRQQNFITRFIKNTLNKIFRSDKKLKNLWDLIGVDAPSGYWKYIKTQSNERIWRKYEVNENKDRSKFFPAQRIIITNKIIQGQINTRFALREQLIVDIFPVHDPYIMKNIYLSPYLISFRQFESKNRIVERKKDDDQLKQPKISTRNNNNEAQNEISAIFNLYQCQYNAIDFTNSSLQDRLGFKLFDKTNFPVQSVRFYCGEKIAFYFEFLRFLTSKSKIVILFALVLQIMLWHEQTDLTSTGSSQLTTTNNILVFIFTIINIIWTTYAVENWKRQEIRLAQSFGVDQLYEEDQKRSEFQGQFKRNFTKDQLNFQYVPYYKVVIKSIFTFLLNVSYTALVIIIFLLIFVFQSFLFQKKVSTTIYNSLPSTLISVVVQIANFLFTKLMSKIALFQNAKTISQFESSLISKSFMVTLVLRFFTLFVYAFFADLLEIKFICRIRTTSNLVIYNCDYYLSQQLLSFVLIDLVFGAVFSLLPYIMFLKTRWTEKKIQEVKFQQNLFESIDDFYEEEDTMQSYMYNQEIDRSWQAYLQIVSKFTLMALFAPVLPLTYVLIYVGGCLNLHTGKFEIIYSRRRSIPTKVNSINIWLIIVEIISYSSIVMNLLYMIYTRGVFSDNKPNVLIALLIIFFMFKIYLMKSYEKGNSIMGKRNEINIKKVLAGKGRQSHEYIPQKVNTDIQNVIYNETKLKRKFPLLPKPNIKTKEVLKHL